MIYLLNWGALVFHDFTRAPTIKKGIVMGVKLTFSKSFELHGAAGAEKASLDVLTTDGEPVDNVISVTVDQTIGNSPTMTLVVMVEESYAENVAVRLKK